MLAVYKLGSLWVTSDLSVQNELMSKLFFVMSNQIMLKSVRIREYFICTSNHNLWYLLLVDYINII